MAMELLTIFLWIMANCFYLIIVGIIMDNALCTFEHF